MQVPLRMPQIRKSSSPANPSCNPEITGTPPATDAPKWICRFIWRARPINSGPQCAINCLLAVTTDLPEVSARRIQSSLGSRPPMTSTTMSAFDDKMSSIFSVHCTEEGSQSTFFRATLRLRTWVRRRCVLERSQRIRATELPTVPKPSRATLQLDAPAFRSLTFRSPTTALLPVESSLEAIPSPLLRIVPASFYYHRSLPFPGANEWGIWQSPRKVWNRSCGFARNAFDQDWSFGGPEKALAGWEALAYVLRAVWLYNSRACSV
ncbi:hypothetical protein SBA7_1290008 [Candidatus Sulfotelmatobacter sp. SbA7]|nr:hypothetical protein SBA7_1290008 [Candidatus Sulfotelmatobacter sp. SbA7]